MFINFSVFLFVRISHFAHLYSIKLGLSESALKKSLWGDFYLDTKAKRIRKGAQVRSVEGALETHPNVLFI